MSKPTRADMKHVLPDALDAFWAVIAKHYKKFGITTGDLDLAAEMKLQKVAEEVVTAWVEGNYIGESSDMNSCIKSFDTYMSESVPTDIKHWDTVKLGKLFKVDPNDIKSVDYVFGKLVIYYVDQKAHPAFRGQTIDQNIAMSSSEIQQYKK